MIKRITLTIMFLATFVFAQPTEFSGYSHPIPDFPPSEPTNLVATNGIGKITLSWEAPLDRYGTTDTDISAYVIRRKAGIDGTWASLSDSLSTLTSHTDQNNLIVGTTYYYKVRAKDASSQNSGYSNEDSGSPEEDTTPPTIPTSFLGSVAGTSITLNWNASTDIDGSGVENYSGTISTTSDFSLNNINFTVSSTSYSFSGNETTLYYLRVRAKDYSGNYSVYATTSATTGLQSSDPIVTSLQFIPSFNNGNVIIINGSNFGVGTPPVLYDNFDDGGSNGSVIGYSATVGSWSEMSNTLPVYDTSVSHVGASMRANLGLTNGPTSSIQVNSSRFNTGIYIDAWINFNYETSAPWCRKNQPFYVRSTANAPEIHFDYQYATGSFPCPSVTEWKITTYGGEAPQFTYATRSELRAVWKHLQMWFKPNIIGQRNGQAHAWLDCISKYNENSVEWRAAGEGVWERIMFGYYYALDSLYGCDTPQGTWDNYWDSIYVSNTQARVEIGNNSIYNNCTQREIQIPTVWNSSQITVTTNLGTFNVADDLYIFVVDSNGVASTGKIIQ